LGTIDKYDQVDIGIALLPFYLGLQSARFSVSDFFLAGQVKIAMDASESLVQAP
jgi:hypothetical protein